MTIPILRRLACVSGALAVAALAAQAPFAQDHHDAHWTYSGATGPEHWGELEKSFSACQQGHQQSPIDIRDAKDADLPPIQFAYRSAPLHIVNNGHTIQVNYAPGSFITVGNKRYQLTQFHFHHPSEEKVDGKNFEMVAHLVHTASDGTLAVVAVLLTPGTTNPLLTEIWPHLPKHEGSERKLEAVPINIAELLPKDRAYYTFTGSLTTPPCTEGVTWFVLKEPKPISKAQADTFGKLYPSDARPVQPLNQREVLASKK